MFENNYKNTSTHHYHNTGRYFCSNCSEILIKIRTEVLKVSSFLTWCVNTAKTLLVLEVISCLKGEQDPAHVVIFKSLKVTPKSNQICSSIKSACSLGSLLFWATKLSGMAINFFPWLQLYIFWHDNIFLSFGCNNTVDLFGLESELRE